MKSSHEDSLLSVVEDISPPTSPTPAVFTTELNRDEIQVEDDHGKVLLEMRPNMSEPRSDAAVLLVEKRCRLIPRVELMHPSGTLVSVLLSARAF